LATAGSQIVRGFDLAAVAVNGILAVLIAWVIAWSAEQYYRRQGH
jgi:hypothetical protein